MAFNFSEWAKNLPQEARDILISEGYNELSTLRECTEEDISKIITKQGHRKVVWENIRRLQEGDVGCERGWGGGGGGGVLHGTMGYALQGLQALRFWGRGYDPNASSKVLQRSRTELTNNDPSEIRIVLFGKTGAGKSSIGNAILGVDSPNPDEIGFKDKPGFVEFFGQGSGTKDCRTQAVIINGKTVRVVDTPGVCDTHRDANEVLFEICKCLLFASPGPHLLLFVINGQSRFTKEEYEAYTQLRNMFDATLSRYICIAFTHCEDLEDGKKSLENIFETSKKRYEQAKLENRDPPDINKVLDDVNRRYVIMYTKPDKTADKREKRDKPVLELLNIVEEMQAENPSPYFQDVKIGEITRQKDLRLQEIMRQKGIKDRSEAWKILVDELQQENLVAQQKAEMEKLLQEQNLAARNKNLQTYQRAGVGLSIGALLAGVALTVSTGGVAAPLAAAAVGAASGAAGASAVKGGCCVM